MDKVLNDKAQALGYTLPHADMDICFEVPC